MEKRIKKLEEQLSGLKNDARYWDLRRTYGDYSREVLTHLYWDLRRTYGDYILAHALADVNWREVSEHLLSE